MSAPTHDLIPRRCRYCPAEVYDLRHERSMQRAPITVATFANGNVAINEETRTYRIVPPGPGLHKNHFSDCPGAQEAAQVAAGKRRVAQAAQRQPRGRRAA